LSPLEEMVLVVKTGLLSRQGALLARGFRQGVDPFLLQSIERNGFFVPRTRAEHCADMKQIILYLVLKHGNSVFMYQRVKATTETRLMNLYSIGLGGHINPAGGLQGEQLLSMNLNRELKEEVQFEGAFSYRLIGTVNDDQSEVGRYHLGIVYLVSCPTPEIRIRETEKLAGGLVPIAEVASHESSLETWSALILPGVIKICG